MTHPFGQNVPTGPTFRPGVERARVMGVLNVTPDSFSDGGRYLGAADAIARGIEMVRTGADLIDIGGESTRPGSQRVTEAEELSRVLPVVQGLVQEGVTLSIDTTRPAVAAAAIEAGARIINDVSGGLADPEMLPLAAATGAPIVLMHWRGHADTMNARNHYEALVPDVLGELGARIDAALEAGIEPERIIIDPGFGFSKLGDQNWELMAGLDRFVRLGYPVLVAASRKRFLITLAEDTAGGDEPVTEADRDAVTAAVSTLAASAGVWAVRVHEPRGSRLAVEAARALGVHRQPPPGPPLGGIGELP